MDPRIAAYVATKPAKIRAILERRVPQPGSLHFATLHANARDVVGNIGVQQLLGAVQIVRTTYVKGFGRVVPITGALSEADAIAYLDGMSVQ